jgi:hypothetical protein
MLDRHVGQEAIPVQRLGQDPRRAWRSARLSGLMGTFEEGVEDPKAPSFAVRS